MQIIEIDQDVLAQFPEAQVRLVAAHGIDNSVQWPEVEERLEALEASLRDESWKPFDESDPQIASWHEAFRKFGTNPRRIRSSCDALSRRLAKTGSVPRISSAVDLYNYISVLYGTPAGAFDQAALDGEVRIRFAASDDLFTPLGQAQAENVKDGEVVYADRSRVLTRHWNHRDCDQTKVTTQASNILYIIERISATAVSDETMSQAQDVLVELLAPRAVGLFRATLGAASPSALLPHVAARTPDRE